MWEAIRRLSNVHYNAGEVTIWGMKDYTDIFSDNDNDNDNESFSQLIHEDTWEAADFSRSSPELLPLTRIPGQLIEMKMTLDLQVSFRSRYDMGLTLAGAPRLVARVLLFD